jgi:GT2 family glycosyltransferase
MHQEQARPAVSVFMTVRNEAPHLERVVKQIFSQDYSADLEVVMSVGPSDDETYEVAQRLARRYPQLKLLDNPSGRIPDGLNLAWRATKYDYLVRADGHSFLPPTYVRQAVELLERTGAANVGGMMQPEGGVPFQKAVARAMSSVWGIGPSAFHTGRNAGPAETVYLGTFRKEDLEEVGGYDPALSRGEDWELNHRLIKAGKLVWFDPSLAVVYWPRSSLGALVRQFFATGRWRYQILREHPQTASLRYLAPPVLVLGLAASAALGFSRLARNRSVAAALLLPAVYSAGLVTAASVSADGLDQASRRRLPLAMAAMHLSWGSGFLIELFGSRRCRKAN